MLRPDLQEERSAAQREGPSAEGAALVPLQDSDVVRDGDTYYLVINNLGERCVLFSARFIDCMTPHRCMAHSPAWIINPFNGKRIFGSGGGDWKRRDESWRGRVGRLWFCWIK